jgi:hypothetical protein
MGVKNKKDVNAAAEGAETQLVQIRNTATTDGKVDLAKVQDIVHFRVGNQIGFAEVEFRRSRCQLVVRRVTLR